MIRRAVLTDNVLPVTIFMIDAIQQVAYNVLFTSMLIGDGGTALP